MYLKNTDAGGASQSRTALSTSESEKAGERTLPPSHLSIIGWGTTAIHTEANDNSAPTDPTISEDRHTKAMSRILDDTRSRLPSHEWNAAYNTSDPTIAAQHLSNAADILAGLVIPVGPDDAFDRHCPPANSLESIFDEYRMLAMQSVLHKNNLWLKPGVDSDTIGIKCREAGNIQTEEEMLEWERDMLKLCQGPRTVGMIQTREEELANLRGRTKYSA